MLKQYMLPGEKLSSVYRDHLAKLPQAGRFLGLHFSEAGVFDKTADRVAASFSGDRSRLVEMLLDYNREMGCSPQTEVQIEKLQDPRAVVVLCGQQAGLLGGPLYTMYKGICAVKLAGKLELELGRPVVPVFWIAAEDHDFSEANHTWVPTENRPQRIQLELEHGGEPVGQLALSDEAGKSVLQALGAVAPESEFLPEIFASLEETRQASRTPADWFARMMARLYAQEGLVLFNPLNIEGRRMASAFFVEAIHKQDEMQTALANREAALRAEGYPLQVEREPESTMLMVVAGKRTALYFREGRYATRDGSLSYSKEELLELAEREPESLSPNVLLRPLVQDFLFPTVAFIPGPGELAYFTQVMALYPVFDMTPPVLWPRPGLTVIEPRLARYITRYEIPERELLRDLSETLSGVLRRVNDVDIDSVFDHLRQHLELEYDHLKRDLSKLNPQLAALADKNLQHVYGQIRYLEERAETEFKKKNEGTLRHFAAMEQMLQPFGKLQERFFGIFPFLLKYGPDFWRQLVNEFPVDPGHYLFYYQPPGKRRGM
jgi:bacillithiol biosynthesis cysteine-adding enzyme BshC